MPHSALIIDDEPDIRELIAMSLDRIGLNTHTAANLEEARNLLETYQFDVCLTDMKLPDGNGVEFVKSILRLQPDLPVAVITAHGNMDAAVEAMKNGAFDFVSKPVDLGLLRKLVAQAVTLSGNAEAANSPVFHHVSESPANDSAKTADTESTGNTAAYQLESVLPGSAEKSQTHSLRINGEDKLVGNSEPMRDLKVMIQKVARTNAPVWITGESGTGKELIARLIHDNGPRSRAPFVPINCGAIPSELMESEMFGHRKGSFTGAHSEHEGLFKRAEGGTLFLDEVAELPLHMQVKLLRAIQERKVRPVGSSDETGTNVRILSASHKDLGMEVERGMFRHDLYYRLNVICIRAPSLRHRSDDIIYIAQHVLRALSANEHPPRLLQLSSDAQTSLRAYQFPGNVRELENILERAVALSETDQIEACDLNLNSTVLSINDSGSGNSEDSSERQAIVDMLSQTRWNRKAAATRLGMSYRQLRYRIKQYGIDNDRDAPDT